MPTYLLAFIVSDFVATEARGIHHVYARSEEIENGHGSYALEIGYRALTALEEFVDLPYSLAKMDQAAIPNDYFGAGAMENWGLVTYREIYLLYSNETSLASQQYTITTIVAHEFGHQFFGNLVSPKWWEYIWLNEGFATYFEFYLASIAEPTWAAMDQFVIKNVQYAFGPDSSETTRAMNTDAGSPSDVSALFDRVAYEKSGSVIRMFETFLTTPVFRAGLKKYLTNVQYDAAEPSDLYSALQEALVESNLNLLPTGYDVSRILTTWDSIPGYPVVNVARNYSGRSVTFTQSRFLLQNSEGSSQNLWAIPINYATTANNDFEDLSTNYWLTATQGNIQIADLSPTDWILVNKKERGYYRVNYDEENWRLIIDYLNTDSYQSIDRTNRAQLIDDAFNLARSGRLNYQIPFQLTTYLFRELDYIPMYSFFNALGFIDTELHGSELFNIFKRYILDILESNFQQLGTQESPNDNQLNTFNRINVLNWLCKYGHEQCRSQGLEQLHLWKSGSISIIAPNVQAPLFCGAAAVADQEHWDFLYSEYEVATEATLRTRILNGLGCSEDTAILEGYLNKAIDTTSSLAAGHRTTVFAAVYNAGNIGLQFALNFAKQHLNEIHNTTNSANAILTAISAKLSTEAELAELTEIVEQYNLNQGILDNARANIEWSRTHLPGIESWLRINRSTAPSIATSGILIATSFVLYFLLK